jgi:hypothetical protein
MRYSIIRNENGSFDVQVYTLSIMGIRDTVATFYGIGSEVAAKNVGQRFVKLN